MGLKNVKISLPHISKELEKTNSSREFLIKNNREVIINCSQAIIAIHKNDLDSAKLKIKIFFDVILSNFVSKRLTAAAPAFSIMNFFKKPMS